MAVKLDVEKCTGCFGCVISCPNALFIIIEGKARVDNTGCISCGICAQTCQNGAIVLLHGQATGGGGYY